jgi:hypothetical protein
LTAAIKAAPTVGFIWGDGPTGYSIKYAWHAVSAGGRRVVLATDRRLGAHSTSWPVAPQGAADAEFTVIEMRLGDTGAGDPSTGSGSPRAGVRGEGKASLTSNVVVDAGAATLAIDAYDAAPVLFTVTR